MNGFPKRSLALTAAITLLATALVMPARAGAQEKGVAAIVPAPIVPVQSNSTGILPRSRYFTIPVRNVRAREMAAWLDPKNHPVAKGAIIFRPGKEVTLPGGIEQILVFEASNSLLVKGTEEGVRALTATIALLDKAMRRVHVDSELWRVSNNALTPDLERLVQASKNQEASMAVLPDEAAKALKKLGPTDKAQLIIAPQNVWITNNIYHWVYDIPIPKRLLPDPWQRHAPGFYSDMPTFKPKPTDPDFLLPNVRSAPPAPASVNLQIEPSIGENDEHELAVSGQRVNGVIKKVVPQGQTLVVFLPQDEAIDNDSKTFLLLKPRRIILNALPFLSP